MSGEVTKIIKEINQGKIPPYIVIHGDDELFVSQSAQEIAEVILPPEERDFNYDLLSGKELDFSELFSQAHTYPFLGERRLIIVKEAYFFAPKSKDAVKLTSEAKRQFADTREVEQILKEEPVEFSTIIFTASFVIKKTDPLFKLILKHGVEILITTAKKFNPNTDRTYLLAEKTLRARGKKIDYETYELLLAKCGNNSRLILDELEKVATYIGDEAFITNEHINELVVKVAEENIFQFLEDLTSKKLANTLIELNRLKEENNRPEILLFMIINNFRWINQLLEMRLEGAFKNFRRFDYYTFQNSIIPVLKEKYSDVLPSEKRANVLMQHPFVIMKNYQACLKYKPTEIKKIMEALERIDIAMKTSSSDIWLKLENLILIICNAAPVALI